MQNGWMMMRSIVGLKPQLRLAFDYESLDADVRDEAMQLSGGIIAALDSAYGGIWDAGQLLMRQKDLIPGAWLEWLRTELKWSERKAQMVMSVPARFERDEYIDLSRVLPDSAFYELAAPSTPEQAIDQVKTVVAAGIELTVREVKQIARSTKPATVVAVESKLRRIDLTGMTRQEIMTKAQELTGQVVSEAVLDTVLDNLVAASEPASSVPEPPRVHYVGVATPPDHSADEPISLRKVVVPTWMVERLERWGNGSVISGIGACMQAMFREMYGVQSIGIVTTGADAMALVAYDIDGGILDRMEVV